MSFGLVLPYSMSLLYGSMLWGYRKGSRANSNYEFVGIKRIKCYLPWKICLWCNTAPALHILDRIYELTSVTVVLNYLDFTVFTRLLRYSCPSHWLMSNSIHSTIVSSVGVVSRCSRTTSHIMGPLTHDPGVPPVASQHNFIVQPLVTKE